MAKKQKPLVYVGSLTFHWFQYITKWNMFCNGKDLHGTRFLRHWHETFLHNQFTPQQPNFEWSFKIISGMDNHSHLIVGWVNGIERKFYLDGDGGVGPAVMDNIHYYTQMCLEQRDEDNDDEPEDETKILL